MNVDECMEKGLLKPDKPDIQKALRSIVIARSKLSKAAKLQQANFIEDALVNGYASMFHAGRAILFRDGFKEKSHYGLYVYLSEKYKDKLEPRFLNELDSLRMERHDVQYALHPIKVSGEEIAGVLETARQFIDAIEKALKKS